ncbi:cytochrome b-c1 complex subunit 1, mitochondrial isoform X2 [Neodiprion lecontei]|nr:cytochrome b-c1 complex subunit 1, mitochondrial isoform X2 [Neodiprion lecontei]
MCKRKMKVKRSKSLSPEPSSSNEYKRPRIANSGDSDNDYLECRLLNLSDDVLLHIMKFLHPQDLMALSLCCQRLEQVTRDRTLWSNCVDFRTAPTLLEDLEKYVKFFRPMTTRLRIRGNLQSNKHRGLSQSFFSAIRATCQLKELTMEEYDIDADKIQITDFPKMIEKLSLKGCRMHHLQTDKSYFFRMDFHMPNLTCLILSKCNWFYPHSLMVISKMVKLKELRLDSCYRLGECVAYASLATRFGFKSLEILDLRDTGLGDSEICCFSSTKTLTHLYLECPRSPRPVYCYEHDPRPYRPPQQHSTDPRLRVFEDQNILELFKFGSSCGNKYFWTAKRFHGNSNSQSLCIPEQPLEFCELRNGMKVVCAYKSSDVTTVGFFVPAGSMHEKCKERGASLFMEHLIFRETRCRDQLQIEQALEEIGGKLGALAMHDMFLFWGTVPSCDIEKLFNLLGDIINNGIIVNDEVDKERFTILHELQEIDMDGERIVMDYLKNIAYQGTELSKSVYPETCAIKCLSAETISSFRDRFFKFNLMTIVCTGGTSLATVNKCAEAYIICCDEDSAPSPDSCETQDHVPLPLSYRFSAIDMRHRDDDEKLAHVALAVETPGFGQINDQYALTVAKDIVGSWDVTCGGGDNNAQSVAHYAFNYNLCHVYKSFNIAWANTGLWGCYFACDRMLLQDTLWVIQNEWFRLCTSITEKEVQRAVNQCKTRELAKLNSSIDRFFDIAVSLFRQGRYEQISQRLCKYDEIKANAIRDIASKYIYDQCPAVAAFGPVENLPDYTRIRSSMYRLRY